MTWYVRGNCYDQYQQPLTESCQIIVSDIATGNLIASTTSSGNGYFNIPVSVAESTTFIVTFYIYGSYELDANIAGANFIPTISGA